MGIFKLLFGCVWFCAIKGNCFTAVTAHIRIFAHVIDSGLDLVSEIEYPGCNHKNAQDRKASQYNIRIPEKAWDVD
jgi:hypothetical protein